MRIIYVCLLAITVNLAIATADIKTTVNEVVETVVYDIGLVIAKIKGEDEAVEPKEVAPEGRAETLIVYSADWCRPCIIFKPILARLKLAGYHVKVVDVEEDELEYDRVEDSEELNEWNKVPTIFYVRNGEVIQRDVGIKSYRHIVKTLWKP